ncbi:unnamed protein product [Boreogadus saida]
MEYVEMHRELQEVAHLWNSHRLQDIVESTATSPPPPLPHAPPPQDHPRHPFQGESAREQERHEESEAKAFRGQATAATANGHGQMA